MLNKQKGFSLWLAVSMGSIAGIAVVLLAVWLSPIKSFTIGPQIEPSIEYGRRLIRETAALMGPGHEDPEMRFSGTYMDCASCHLDAGARPGT